MRPQTPVSVIYLIYLAAIAMTTALLVFWVLVVQRFTPQINETISSLGGVQWNHFHWFIQSTGAAFFFLVLVALTYLLAITLSERRYRVKQEHFLSNISHELKSPVAAIQLHAQTLESGELAPAEVTELSGYVVREAQRIRLLVENLLESGRIQSGQARIQKPIDLREFFRDYQQVVRERFDLREIDLVFEVQTRSAVMSTTDALQRVMDNLIGNAIRFTEAGGRILCQVRDRHDDTEIVIADTGLGIPKTELTKVFERFYRLARDEGQRKGTGLGLAIVRGLVQEMRGKIRAVSGDGEPGTRFEIRLPQARSIGSIGSNGSNVSDRPRIGDP